MSTILEHPTAQSLLEATEVAPDDLNPCLQRLTAFVQRYLPLFARDEQRCHAQTILQGKLTGLQRKTTEPIASQAGLKRRPLQHFLGAGLWDDRLVRSELRQHVRHDIGDPKGALIVDGHGVAKKGSESCGVGRQWCGRLGKVDNCQVGYFLAYAGKRGKALVDACLYLPEERAADVAHRTKTYVPPEVVYQEGWRLALDMVLSSGREVPHAWLLGDDEFGRVSHLRGLLRLHGERYVLDVPCNTLVRDLSHRRPPTHDGGRERLALFEKLKGSGVVSGLLLPWRLQKRLPNPVRILLPTPDPSTPFRSPHRGVQLNSLVGVKSWPGSVHRPRHPRVTSKHGRVCVWGSGV